MVEIVAVGEAPCDATAHLLEFPQGGNFMKKWKVSVLAVALGILSSASTAQTVVATWNVAWLMAKPTYETWASM